MPAVTFDVAAFRTRFPEFSNVTDAQLRATFDEAGALYLDNTDASPVSSLIARASLLNLLVAHLTQLTSGSAAQAALPLVGPVTNVSEGSVSIAGSPAALPSSAAWYGLTKYGASFWAAAAAYRTMRYVPGRSWPQERTRDGSWL